MTGRNAFICAPKEGAKGFHEPIRLFEAVGAPAPRCPKCEARMISQPNQRYMAGSKTAASKREQR